MTATPSSSSVQPLTRSDMNRFSRELDRAAERLANAALELRRVLNSNEATHDDVRDHLELFTTPALHDGAGSLLAEARLLIARSTYTLDERHLS